MATITSAQSGNFFDSSTWVGGIVPSSLDDAVAASGHVITINADVAVLSASQAGTGKFVLPGGRTITANITIGSGTFFTGGTVEVIATSGQTATINGNISGPTSTLDNQAGVVVSGTGQLIVNGNVSGTLGTPSGTSTRSAAIYTTKNCLIVINGNVTGGGPRTQGIFSTDFADSLQIEINGTVCGGGSGGSIANNPGGYGIESPGKSVSLDVVGKVGGAGGNLSHSVYLMGWDVNVSVIGMVEVAGGVYVGIYGISGSFSVVGDIVVSFEADGASRGSGIFLSGSPNTTFASNALAINSDVSVVGNISCAGGASDSYGIANTSLRGTTNITGNITATTGTGAVIGGPIATALVVGNVSGGSATSCRGISLVDILSGNASMHLKVIGNVVAGTGSSAEGIGTSITGARATIEVIGNVAANGQTNGITHQAWTTFTSPSFGVSVQGTITDSTVGAVAIYSRVIRLLSGSNTVVNFANAAGFPNGGYVSVVSPDLVIGMPSPENVKAGIAYGHSNALLGTMKLPPVESVAFGEQVENSEGTALFATSDIVDVISAQIAAAMSSAPEI